MTRVETVRITCDVTPDCGPAATHRVSLDGAAYDLDLCDAHLAALADLVRSGRPVTAPPPRPAAGRRRTAAIRAWAVREGLISPDQGRGRIPVSVTALYDAAHGGAR